MPGQIAARKEFHHPFEPYDIQQQFMEGVYDCIEQKQVGIFESPTGTGKSLSLICGSLTWLREHKRRIFDEALATIDIDEDEPDWLSHHARDVRSREMRQMREDLDTRLSKAREREKRLNERQQHFGPALKKQRPEDGINAALTANEESFVLDDYDSDEEAGDSSVATYSSETAKLMQTMSLTPGKNTREPEDDTEESKVFFCSRTHSQLSQFIGELKRVRMPPGLPLNQESNIKCTEDFRHVTLGSRKNLCINPKVKKLPSQTAINERCVELQQKRSGDKGKCQFLPTKASEDKVFAFRDHALATIRDIEDLADLGTKLQVCPYYASRAAISPAEVVTLPYPLLLQKAAREALGISLKGHIVIVDEAHNLMNAVEGTYSAQILRSELSRAKDCLITYLQRFRDRLKGSNRAYVTQVVRVVDSLLLFATSISGSTGQCDTTSPAALLAGKAVDQINLAKLVRYIDESKLARKVEGYAAYISQNAAARGSDELAQSPGVPALTSVQNFLMTLMNPSKEGRFTWSRQGADIVIQYLLLDPSEHFRDIVEDARAVVLAGGTMSPMDDYRQQLFPYLDSIKTFSCGHLIPTSSLFVRSITTDRAGRLDFTFKSRNDANASRLGEALLTMTSEIKGGMVVFVPSYGYLDSVLRVWKTTSMTKDLEAKKAVFLDSRIVSAEETFRAYSDAVRSDKRGALLLSVVGGKLSEGINFSDDLGRCVVVVGLPYPNLDSADWRAKMQYLDEKATDRGEAKGKASREHAENVCMRSVNQAIGRAIRHKNDWAGIVLFDARYADGRIQAKLPAWIKASYDTKASGSVEDVVKDLRTFFTTRSIRDNLERQI